MNKYIFLLLIVFNLYPAKTNAQFASFAGCDYSQGIVFIMKNNEVVWKHPASDSNDIQALPNGTILFTTGKGVLEMNQQNDTLFHYSSTSHIFACQRLENGNTFVGECTTGRLLEIAPNGDIVKEINILPEGITEGGFGFMRNARRLNNGNTLVAHYADELVKEYDCQGRVVWSAKVPGGPHSLLRLPNGNTVISVADMTQNPRLIELNKEGECIWEFSNKDLPDAPLKFLGGFQYFADDKILFTNWTGHEKPENKIHLFLITKEKEVLFLLKDHPAIETMSSVHSLPIGEEINSYH